MKKASLLPATNSLRLSEEHPWRPPSRLFCCGSCLFLFLIISETLCMSLGPAPASLSHQLLMLTPVFCSFTSGLALSCVLSVCCVGWLRPLWVCALGIFSTFLSLFVGYDTDNCMKGKPQEAQALTKGVGNGCVSRELECKDNRFLPKPLAKFCLYMFTPHSLWLLWQSHLLKT